MGAWPRQPSTLKKGQEVGVGTQIHGGFARVHIALHAISHWFIIILGPPQKSTFWLKFALIIPGGGIVVGRSEYQKLKPYISTITLK